jgi:DNA-binding transcriptional LysR family regulator
MDLDALADFVAVVKAGAITAGARARGQPKQSVSRRLLLLEQELGVRLFDRSTRALRLTAEGALLNERAGRILADLEETRRALKDRASEPEGPLRISAPVLLGQTVLGAVAAAYVRAHPKVKLDLVLSDRRVDLIEEGFDAAIRVGPVTEQDLVGRLFATSETILVAAPQAIQTIGSPRKPQDLVGKPCIVFGDGRASMIWRLQHGEETQDVAVTGPLSVSSLKLAHDVAVAGGGIANLPAFLARDALASGALVRVLAKWHAGIVDLRIVFPTRRLLSIRLRAFIDTLVAAFPERRL